MVQIEDNDSPITVAQKIIHGTKLVDMTPVRTLGVLLATGKAPEDREQYETDMFDDSEIREIADYLLTYCEYHEGE